MDMGSKCLCCDICAKICDCGMCDMKCSSFIYLFLHNCSVIFNFLTIHSSKSSLVVHVEHCEDEGLCYVCGKEYF